MQLTNTKHDGSLRYHLPDLQNIVEVHLPASQVVSDLLPFNSRNRILQILVHSKWSPGAHWRESFVKHICILKGKARVWINGECREFEPGDEAAFGLFDIQDFSRADVDIGEDLLIEEWVDDGESLCRHVARSGTDVGESMTDRKECFFRNAFPS